MVVKRPDLRATLIRLLDYVAGDPLPPASSNGAVHLPTPAPEEAPA